MDRVTPLQQAAGILGEHFENFLIVVNHTGENNGVCECEWNNPYAAKTLAEQGTRLIKDSIYPTQEYEWAEETDDDDDSDECLG